MHIAYIGVGSSIEPGLDVLTQAVLALKKECEIQRISQVYHVSSMNKDNKEAVMTCIVKIKTYMSSHALLEYLQWIEQQIDVIYHKDRTVSRSVDVDILFYDHVIMHEHHLTLPHPLIQDKLSLLLPLVEIAPTIYHPVYEKPVSALLQVLYNRINNDDEIDDLSKNTCEALGPLILSEL